ncbi:MAG: TonB-dependent siderophore receptor [Sphingobacteriaceae bacterium]|nr:MAG: TonB-dependent siderophore receptor [Sphingobacteriaceae bacterium]
MKILYKRLSYCIIIFTLLHLRLSAQNFTGTISGIITTKEGKPASQVTVRLKEINRVTITSENGAYLIKGLKEGSYTLKISHTGLKAQEQTIQVLAGKTIRRDFRLTENANQLSEIQIKANKSANQKTVSVGKSGIIARDLPQSIQILDSTVIKDQQVNRLADVMKNVNGVAFGENRGSTNDAFFARGYSLGGNNVLKNGARTSIGGSPETSTLESVEVLKGSAALLYGGVTGGAVVNLVTKKPKFNFGGEVSMRAGSYDLYKPIVDVYGPVSKNIAFRAIATKENAGSFRDNVKADRFYVNPSLLFKLGQNTELIVQGDYLKSNYTPDFGIGTVDNKIVDIGRNKFLNTLWAYNNTNTTSAQANLTHRFNDSWKLNVLVAYQGYNRNYFSAERPAANAAGVAARNLTRSKSEEYTYNQQINLTGAAKTGSIKHLFLIGGDADQARTTSYGFKYDNNATTYNYGNINLLSGSDTYNTRTDIPATRIISNTFAPVFRMGGFAQDLISFTDKLKLLAGIRYSFQKTPRTITYNNETNVTTLSNNSLGRSKVESAFSPKVGFIYQPLKTTSVYVSYANNFTSNTGTDVNFAPLTPSIIDQYEAGVKNDFWNGKLSVNVTVYKILNDKFAQTALYRADGVTPNTDATIKEFSGSTASDGVEVDITGKLAKGLNFLAGYSYNYFRYTKTLPITRTTNANGVVTTTSGIVEGERIIGSTPHTANGTLFYTFSSGPVNGLKLGASAFYTGKRNMGFNTLKAGNGRGVPILVSDFTTFDLSAGYTYRKLSLITKLSNITNELNYFVHENYSVNPIAPRMVIATLSYKF